MKVVNDKLVTGPFADLAHQARQKREASQLVAELRQLATHLRQRAARLHPALAKKCLVGLLIDAAEEAETQAKALEGRW